MASHYKHSILFIGIILIGTILSGCIRTSNNAGQPSTSFLPPTTIPSATPLPVTPSTKSTPSADCENVLSFMEDITIPDGTEVKPGDELDKRWQVRNNGTCDWDDRYKIRRIAGDPLGSPEEQALYPALAGSSAIIRMVLKAPAEVGTYRSAWQSFDPSGNAFGDPFFIEIVVKTE